MFLVAHSIELILKSYLRNCGYSLQDLKGINHGLMHCWRACCDKGIQNCVILESSELEVLDLISNLHQSTELRYIQTGPKTLPVFGRIQALTRKLLTAICPIVGYVI